MTPVFAKRNEQGNGCYLHDVRLPRALDGAYRLLRWKDSEPHVRLNGHLCPVYLCKPKGEA